MSVGGHTRIGRSLHLLRVFRSRETICQGLRFRPPRQLFAFSGVEQIVGDTEYSRVEML